MAKRYDLYPLTIFNEKIGYTPTPNTNTVHQEYNHFEFIERERERINADPKRSAFIVTNKKGERALFVNKPFMRQGRFI